MRILLLCVLCAVSLSGQTVTRLASQAGAGNLATNGDVINFSVGALGFGSLGVEASGTWTGTAVIECAASASGGTFVALQLIPRNSGTAVTSFTVNGQWLATVAGCQRIRARATAVMTGSAQITMVGVFE